MIQKTSWQDKKWETKSAKHSSWWMPKVEEDQLDQLFGLSSLQKTVSNFLKIQTGKNVPCKIHGSDSYTDGEKVTISADYKNLDLSVGLALHEASHIVWTDFSSLHYLSTLNELIDCGYGKPTRNFLSDFQTYYVRNYSTFNNIPNRALNHGYLLGRIFKPEYFEAYFTHKSLIDMRMGLVKNLLNWIEDRRIDNKSWKRSPGYVGYYEAIYNKYFNTAIIAKALRSADFREENIQSYMFRICNFTNASSDIDALKYLRKIYNLIDYKNISRLNDVWDSLDIAIEVAVLVIKAADEAKKSENGDNDSKKSGDATQSNQSSMGSQSEGEESSSETSDSSDSESNDLEDNDLEDSDSEDSDLEDSESSDSDSEDTDSDENSGSTNSSNEDVEDSKPELSKREKERAEKALSDIEDLLNGKPKKKKISKQLSDDLETLLDGKVEENEVSVDNLKTKVIVINDLNKKYIDKAGHVLSYATDTWRDTRLEKSINEGLQFGTLLGTKLKIRNDIKLKRTVRKKYGSIDKRLLSEAGFGNNKIFKSVRKIIYDDVSVHISIDASGSMSGDKFRNSMKMAAAVAKAASMIEGMHVVISTRGTTNFEKKYKAYIMKIYDSKKDAISKIRATWPHVGARSATPEGLCFEAIYKEIIKEAKSTDAYFVNLSDGMPTCTVDNSNGRGSFSYCGRTAINHTRFVVNKIKRSGVKILSYFVVDNPDQIHDSWYKQDFITMYGKDAKFIDIGNINQIALTLNRRFIEQD